jgi:3',5'-cyclic-AMP phosphodiesterase
MHRQLSKSCAQPPVKILQLSDLHILPEIGEKLLGVDTWHYFHKVLEQALQEHPNPDLLLLSGDLAQTPTSPIYRHIHAILEKAALPTVCLPGNHDDYELMQKILRGKNIGCNRQSLLNDWHIICLNSKKTGSPGGHLDAEELQHLESYLKTYRQHHTLVAVHHPCCSIDSRWLDAQQIDNGEEFLAILTRHPQVKALTTGHIHQAFQMRRGNIEIFSAPSTCFQFRPRSDDFAIDKTAPGYRWFNLYADGSIESGVSRLPGELSELRTDSQGY